MDNIRGCGNGSDNVCCGVGSYHSRYVGLDMIVAKWLFNRAISWICLSSVYALYNRNKTILWTISLLFIAEITAMITVLAITIPRMTFNAQCLITAAPGLFMAFWWVVPLKYRPHTDDFTCMIFIWLLPIGSRHSLSRLSSSSSPWYNFSRSFIVV